MSGLIDFLEGVFGQVGRELLKEEGGEGSGLFQSALSGAVKVEEGLLDLGDSGEKKGDSLVVS